jgi:hypothetical protein
MLELNQQEHQELVLMLGSRKEWMIYLGLDTKTGARLWTQLGLSVPTAWFRNLGSPEQLALLVKHGSTARLAAHIGVSEAFLKSEYGKVSGTPKKILIDNWTEERCAELFERYRSVRFVARMLGVTEAQLRKGVEGLGLDITTLIDYSFGANSNAKGRRAELEFAEMEKEHILGDRNLIDGSQASYDFDHALYKRVNVKSSRCWRFKAKTRKDDPEFWKISTRGAANADYLVAMCYDEKMTALIGTKLIKADTCGTARSLTLRRADLHPMYPKT